MHFYKDYPVSFSKETGCLTNSVSAEYRKINFQIYIYIYIYIYQIRVIELCLNIFVYPCGPVVRVVDLRPRV